MRLALANALGGRRTGDRRRLPRPAVVVVAAVVALALVVVAGWWTLGGGGTDGPSAVEIEVPPKAVSRAPSDPAIADNSGATVASVPAEAFAAIPLAASEQPLPDAPDPKLVDPVNTAPLPKIDQDGRMPWRVYARPFDARDDRPRIAVIVAGFGLSPIATEAAIRRLPGAVTLAFDPEAPSVEAWARQARRAGHETLLALPLESADFPFEDPGPRALNTALTRQENARRLEALLGRFTGYVGVVTVMGSKFVVNDASVRPILQALKGRGLLYVDALGAERSLGPKIATEIDLPRAFVNAVVDDVPNAVAIDEQLARLEATARARMAAVGLARPYPITLERLSAWAKALPARLLVLAPVSAVAETQGAP